MEENLLVCILKEIRNNVDAFKKIFQSRKYIFLEN